MMQEESIVSDWGLLEMITAMCGEVVWFVAGLMLFRVALRMGLLPAAPRWRMLQLGNKKDKGKAADSGRTNAKAICAASAGGQHEEVIARWKSRALDAGPLPPDALAAVAQALAERRPDALAAE